MPGDKSISHRALILGALAVGETRIEGLLEGEDVLATAGAIRAIGSIVENKGEQCWAVHGCGLGGLNEPNDVIDMGNSGTAARLMLGLLATHPMTSVVTGDASLRSRPMDRVTTPLHKFGAELRGNEDGKLPITVFGTADPVPIHYVLPVASAQVKSAILIAGLNTPGETTVVEPTPTRDHTERMLKYFGAELNIYDANPAGRTIKITGQLELTPQYIRVPSDISSAAFPIVAATLVHGSSVRLNGVGINPLRTGLISTLLEMGAKIGIENETNDGGEPTADLLVTASDLRGIEVPSTRAPSMIDEYPVLAVAAAMAEGPTVMRGLRELRFKESDRLAAVASGLSACGVKIEEGEDYLIVYGQGRAPVGGVTINSGLDHRIAMSFAVLGLVTREPITITGASTINSSFPRFVDLMCALGAEIRTPKTECVAK